MKSPPFRHRIALLSAGISGVVLAVFGTAAYWIISDQKTEALDTEIRSLAMRHRGWLANRPNPQRIGENLAFILGNAGDELTAAFNEGFGWVVFKHGVGWCWWFGIRS